MYAFDYKRAATLEEARKALEGIAESKLLAGGMSIVPVLRYRLAQPSALIDLGRPIRAGNRANGTFFFAIFNGDSRLEAKFISHSIHYQMAIT